LYASPFPPQQSGISDYSAALVRALSSRFDITLYTDNYAIDDPWLRERFAVVREGVDDVRPERYDYSLYNIGNNPWYHAYIYKACLRNPGVVLLHEPVLYYLFVGVYQDTPGFFSRVLKTGGSAAFELLKELSKSRTPYLECSEAHRAPLNAELLRSSNRFLVHSEFARRQLLGAAGRDLDIGAVNHIEVGDPAAATPGHRAEVFRELGIPEEDILIGSFGFVAPTKLNDVVCRAVERANSSPGGAGFHYLMAGEGNYADSYLNERIRVTGFLSARDFDRYLAACDLVVNLRYPVMGETSGALVRAMSAGKPCVVTDAGWFGELPDDVVLKLDPDPKALLEEQLVEALGFFVEYRDIFYQMGKRAAEYARTAHGPQAVAARIYEYLTGAPEPTPPRVIAASSGT
jgi:glycosyltransferase involved in cell wall biosynthesis